MDLWIKTHLQYTTLQPCDLLLQVEAVSDETQTCRETRLLFDSESVPYETAGEAGIGTRRWVKSGLLFECTYETVVNITRPALEMVYLTETPRPHIPGHVIQYLMPSRYCQSDLFLDFVAYQFGHLNGGAMIDAMSNWVRYNFTYDNGVSDSGTTATDSFACLSGVCRDYAHMLIALARAGGVPARFVSAYAPDVDPPDFHAVVEVYLEGAWHIIDPTGMSQSPEVVRICVGRDAADASFLTSYGRIDLQAQSVEVTRLYT